MITYNNNYYYKYSDIPFFEKTLYYELIYKFVRRLSIEYPDFINWFNNLFTDSKELKLDREIIICESNYKIVGLAILKSSDYEKKICTLRVDRRYQHQGIGKKLIQLSLEWLEDDYPVITMHKSKQVQFDSLLKYYGFRLEQTQPHYYSIFSTEYVYNGELPEKSFFFNKFEIMDMQNIYRRFIKSGKYNIDEFIEECINIWCKREKNRMIG